MVISNGTGKGQVAGIKIRVYGVRGGGVSRITNVRVKNGVDTSRRVVRFGDVKIELITNGERFDLRVQEESFGQVERGDKVEVSENRQVLINGTVRPSAQ